MLVYILLSRSTGKYYTGITDNLSDRLERHNGGRSKSTRHGVPWEVVYTRECPNRSVALRLESEIKSRGAGRFLEDEKNSSINGA